MLSLLLLCGDAGDRLSHGTGLVVHFSRVRPSELELGSMTLYFRDEDLRRCFVSEGCSILGLLGRVLHDFLFRADFITKDRTTLSGFALTPPLLESMNMNWVGDFICSLELRPPIA
jgi:hypothetical protein